jgi:valacyclovir hydrolase
MPFYPVPTGATLYTDDVGTGVPVIALHGWLGTGQAHLARLITWLEARSLRVIAPTRRGYGESLPKPRDYPVDFYQRDARDILALMDALDIERAHVLGYSDGGETALCMATMQPERFLTIGVWGAVGSFDPSLRARVQSNYPAVWMDDETKALNHLENQAAADALVLGWIHAVKAMIDAGGDISLSQAHRIRAPLVMMLGETDTLNPKFLADRFAARTPNGRVVMFPCGHAVHDQLWDDFVREVDRLFAQVK